MEASVDSVQRDLFASPGTKHKITFNPNRVQLFFEHPDGKLLLGDSIKFLKSLDSELADLIFADPPYNIKKADWDNFASQEDYIKWSVEWIREAERVLKKDGSLYVCGFSEILADIKYPAMKSFKSCKWLVWFYKNKANLGNDWGRSHESVIHFRKSKKTKLNTDYIRVPYGRHTLKYPFHPQADTSQYSQKEKSSEWRPHPFGAKPKDVIEIPVICNGMEEKTSHPTQKPEELIRKFILASSKKGDMVIDPFSGSGTTLTVAQQLGRKWMGCDISDEYNNMAVKRIRRACRRPEKDWFELDRRNAERRESLR